jgi:hypothetical protein
VLVKLIKEIVYDLFTDDNFLYFEVPKESEEDTQYMRYNEFNFEVIKKEEYFKARYGKDYEKIMDYFKDKNTSRITGKDGSMFVCFYQESIIYKFDKNGSLIRRYDQMQEIDTVYDIALQDNSIWCAYPTSHTVKRFSLENGEEELSVSEGSMRDNRGTIFSYPESILVQGNVMYVSDMGNKRICKVDLISLDVESYIEFSEPVLGYERLRNMEFVLLDSGLYLL